MTKEESEEFHKQRLFKVESHGDEDLKESDKDDHSKADGKKVPRFTAEEYLIASPTVLGFSFSKKFWFEFTVAGIKDIAWNEDAYDSLVLDPQNKETLKVTIYINISQHERLDANPSHRGSLNRTRSMLQSWLTT